MPPSERQADACAAFEQWASSQPGCPRNVVALVESVERADDHAGLMTTEVQGRRVVWKSIAFSGKARVTAPAVTLETIDAWNVDAATLRQRSDHVAVCDPCAGAGKNTCNRCAGIGNLVCGNCNGQRKKYGYAANGSRRLLNCPSCRGKGEVDCPDCRRGVAICAGCDGSGRVQRWFELEWWQRAVASERPEWIPRQFGWPPNPPDDAILRDAEILVDIGRPHRLTPADVGTLHPQWLTELTPSLQPGERIVDQRLRLVRVPTHTVQYRLGSDDDRVPFVGRRLLPPSSTSTSAFARRASHLRGVRLLLLMVLAVLAILSFARGTFYWSIPTLLSLGACAAALGCIHGGVAEWTAARRRMGRWMLGAASCAAAAIGLALAATPRLTHAADLIAAGSLDAGERELKALGGDVPATTWADLRLARIRLATDAGAARAVLENIPRNLPQYPTAADAAGRLLLRDAADFIRGHRWSDAAEAILTARTFGIPESQLAPLIETIRAAGLREAAAADGVTDARARLQRRIAAEAILVASERASGQWGTGPLIALRTSMARDVAALEKAARRRPS